MCRCGGNPRVFTIWYYRGFQITARHLGRTPPSLIMLAIVLRWDQKQFHKFLFSLWHSTNDCRCISRAVDVSYDTLSGGYTPTWSCLRTSSKTVHNPHTEWWIWHPASCLPCWNLEHKGEHLVVRPLPSGMCLTKCWWVRILNLCSRLKRLTPRPVAKSFWMQSVSSLTSLFLS